MNQDSIVFRTIQIKMQTRKVIKLKSSKWNINSKHQLLNFHLFFPEISHHASVPAANYCHARTTHISSFELCWPLWSCWGYFWILPRKVGEEIEIDVYFWYPMPESLNLILKATGCLLTYGSYMSYGKSQLPLLAPRHLVRLYEKRCHGSQVYLCGCCCHYSQWEGSTGRLQCWDQCLQVKGRGGEGAKPEENGGRHGKGWSQETCLGRKMHLHGPAGRDHVHPCGSSSEFQNSQLLFPNTMLLWKES